VSRVDNLGAKSGDKIGKQQDNACTEQKAVSVSA